MPCFPLRLRAAPLAFALALLPACGGKDDTTPTEPGPTSAGDMLTFPVDAPGPYRVGYRSFPVTYTPRGDAGPRTILLHLWYPTYDTEGEHPVYSFIFADDDVFTDASLAPATRDGGYPVHAHSHGFSGFGGTSSNMMRWFASHGWVAVAPDHTGNTLAEHVDKLPIRHFFERPQDISAALDALEALPAGDPLQGKAQTSRVLLSGHSFGTYTTWAAGGAAFDMASVQAKCDTGTDFTDACTPNDLAVFEPGLADPRVVAGLPMAGGVGEDDPGWFGQTGYDAAKRPFMLMSGGDDPVGAENVFARVTKLDLTWLDFAGGCHQLFGLGGCENFPEEEGWAAVDTYALAFARAHVLGDAGELVGRILDGTHVVSPKVTFKHKENL